MTAPNAPPRALLAALFVAACDGATAARDAALEVASPADVSAVVDAAGPDASTDVSRADAPPRDVTPVDAATGDVTPVDAPAADAGFVVRRSGMQGLVPLGLQMAPWGHITQAVVARDAVYVATSFNGLASFVVDAAGAPTLAWSHTAAEVNATPPRSPRCTTLALHAPSSTIYCGAADAAGLAWYRAVSPRELRLDPASRIEYGALGARAVHVVGDTLLLASSSDGLRRASIAADGTPGPPAATSMRGVITGVDGGADALAVLDRARGLVQARLVGGDVVEVGALALDGPLLDVSVRGRRAYVAMGSQGAASIDLTDAGPRLHRRWRPAAVITGIDGDGADTVVCSSSTGVYAFDLAPASPRTVGYRPSTYGALDVRLEGDRVHAVEWLNLAELRLDPHGDVRDIEAPAGYVVAPGRGITFQVRNPGDVPLNVAARAFSGSCTSVDCVTDLRSVVAAPGATVDIALTEAEVTRAMGDLGRASLAVAAREGDAARMGSLMNLTLIRPGPTERVSVGAIFPPLRAPAGSTAPSSIPLPSRATRAVFVTADCALQWNEVEDLAWSSRRGTAAGGATPVVLFVPLHDDNVSPWWGAPFLSMLDAGALGHATLFTYADSLSRAPGAPPTSDSLFTERFGTPYIDGPDTNADYVIDGDGRVANFERLYRGEHPLQARDTP